MSKLNNRAHSFLSYVIFAADFIGEVFADFFGLTQSKYQYVIDAKEREDRRIRWEIEEEKLAKEKLDQKMNHSYTLQQDLMETGRNSISNTISNTNEQNR